MTNQNAMIKFTVSSLAWLMNLFDPPPLELMNQKQKICRVFLVTISLVVSCILLAMLAAMGIYLMEQGQRILSDEPHLVNGLGIVFVGICVNAACVLVLFQIRNADRKLMGKPEEAPADP